MPELPEVETIRRDLEASLQGHYVIELQVLDRRLLSAPEEARFRRIVLMQTWKAIERRGKYLTVDLVNRWQLIIHLRMTGQLVLRTSRGNRRAGIMEKPLGHNYRMLLQFENGIGLAFYDQRRFGEILLRGPYEPWPGKTPLGPDPLNGLDKDRFISMTKEKTTRIKPLLMDQRFLSGVGNIYAQEALFKAGIRPSRPACRVSRSEAGHLFDALQETLLSAIAHRGSTSRNYRDAYGRGGSAQNLHTVYQKGGQPCSRCRVPLRSVRLGGRGTVYCPHCQR